MINPGCDKVQLESESFFSCSQGKTGLMNNIKRNTNFSVTPSPKKFFKEDIRDVPEMDFSTSSQSTTPTGTQPGTTFSLSSKNNVLVSKESSLEPISNFNFKQINIHKSKRKNTMDGKQFFVDNLI